MPQQLTHSIMDDFSRDFERIAAKMSREITRYINAGMTPRRATARVFREMEIPAEMERLIMDGVVTAIVGGAATAIANPDGFRSWYLHHHFQKDALSLSQRIADPAIMEEIADTLSLQMKNAAAWTKAARSLNQADLIKADVAKYIQDVDRSARKVLSGDPAALHEYQRSLRKAKRNIERLARNEAPTSRLKKAHQAVVAAAEKQSVEALDKAMVREIKAKAAYNADRIARTEIARAYGQGTYSRILADDDAVGMKSYLSSRHPEADICNFWAECDLYGMGKGVYPKNAVPPYPYHPHCLCVLRPYYRGEAGEFDSDAPNKFLEAQSEKRQKLLMGAKGQKAWKRNPDRWRANLRNYNDQKSMKSMLEVPKRYEKK